MAMMTNEQVNGLRVRVAELQAACGEWQKKVERAEVAERALEVAVREKGKLEADKIALTDALRGDVKPLLAERDRLAAENAAMTKCIVAWGSGYSGKDALQAETRRFLAARELADRCLEIDGTDKATGGEGLCWDGRSGRALTRYRALAALDAEGKEAADDK